jgi:hypothetical protein
LRREYFGVSFPQSAHCTLEKITEAYVSHFYATRGYTAAEERGDTNRSRSNGRTAVFAIRRQIDELVEAEYVANGSPVAAERAPPDTHMRRSFTEEAQPSHWDIEERHAFRVFGPPAGALSPFWSNEWNQHRQSTSTGAFAGRATTNGRQVSADAAAQSGTPIVFPGTVGDLRQVVGTGRGRSAVTSNLNNSDLIAADQRRQVLAVGLDRLNATAVHQNAVALWNSLNNQRAQEVTQMQMAITAAESIPGFNIDDLASMRASLVSRARAPFPPAPLPLVIPVSVSPVRFSKGGCCHHHHHHHTNFSTGTSTNCCNIAK